MIDSPQIAVLSIVLLLFLGTTGNAAPHPCTNLIGWRAADSVQIFGEVKSTPTKSQITIGGFAAAKVGEPTLKSLCQRVGPPRDVCRSGITRYVYRLSDGGYVLVYPHQNVGPSLTRIQHIDADGKFTTLYGPSWYDNTFRPTRKPGS